MIRVPLLPLTALALLQVFGLCVLPAVDAKAVDIATFNVEWLGHPERSGSWNGSRDSQLDQAAGEILALDVDIVALQEVIVDDVNGNALLDLVQRLNARDSGDTWSGVVSNKFSYWWAPDFENYPAQRQAFVWRNSSVQYVTAYTLLREIPAGDPRFGSGRMPVVLEVEVSAGNTTRPLYLVNLHLKCCRDFDALRNESMTALIAELHSNFADKPLVVLGDFNVADRGGANGEIAEWGFYNDVNGDGSPDFFHGAGSVPDAVWADIDHIVLSDELAADYLNTPEADRNIRFPTTVSDHDPILMRLVLETDDPEEPLEDYRLVWADEFDQPDGSTPDSANWVYETGGWGWGNEEEQYYTTSTDNVRIENGNLIIELREDSTNMYPGNDYTSARLITKDRQAWTHGRFEARIRLPFGDASGLWPAFWMLGTDIDSVGWPQCGEIDILEYVSRIPNEIFGTIHGPGYAGGASFGNIYDLGGPAAPPEPPLLQDPYDPQYYNLYAVEWEPERIRWYFNDILYHEATPADVAPNEWVFEHDFFIILNLAIGGNFGGFIDAPNLVFPTQMLVDYVRVYQRNSEPVVELAFDKEGTFNDENGDGFADPDETVAYTFTLQNTGTVPLTGVTVTDSLLSVDADYPPAPSILANGGFDLGNTSSWATGGTATTAATQAGSHALQISGVGGFVSPGAQQSFPAGPGEEFTLSGYMYAPEALPENATFGLFKIVFQDSSGNDLVPESVSSGQLNTDFPGAESLPFLNASQPTQAWLYSEARAVAPPGTTRVLFFALNIDQSPATILFDSISAVKTQTDPSLSLQPGESDNTTFSATYTLTEDDINSGWITSTATANSNESDPVEFTSQTYLPIDPDADTDGDTYTDLLERAYGLDIFQPDPLSHRPSIDAISVSRQTRAYLTYRRRAGGSGSTGIDYAVDGLSYRVALSHDGTTWQSGPSLIEVAGDPVDNADGTQTITVRTVEPLNRDVTLMRLEVSETLP